MHPTAIQSSTIPSKTIQSNKINHNKHISIQYNTINEYKIQYKIQINLKYKTFIRRVFSTCRQSPYHKLLPSSSSPATTGPGLKSLALT